MAFKLLGKKIHPIIFCRTYWNCTGPEFTKFWNLNGIGDGNDKNLICHVFKYKHTKWLCWCITASLDYKNTMINRITMETVACLRSECHLKQNLIPIWQGSLWAADSWHWRDIIGNAALKEWKRVRLPQSFCVMSGSCGKKSELTFRCLEWKIILRESHCWFLADYHISFVFRIIVVF